MIITARMLKAKGACASQLTIFKATFPKGCPVTIANLELAQGAGLNLGWAAHTLLPAPAQSAYDRATTQAFKAYYRVTVQALAARSKAKASAWAAYNKATVRALHTAAVSAGMAEEEAA